MTRTHSLAFILGGGRGQRLLPLTKDRAKPAVPFGGTYRVIDFALSNLYHSDVRRIVVPTQYESDSLHEHLRFGWYHLFGMGPDSSITVKPARQGDKDSEGWFTGTANAVLQNLGYIRDTSHRRTPDVVNILGGDHIYFMDYSQMNSFHMKNNADLTISAIPVRKKDAAGKLGVLVIDKKGRLVDFEEKPSSPTSMPGNKEYCLGSMGNYSFKSLVLIKELERDEKKESSDSRASIKSNPDQLSSHDFGTDIIPSMLRSGRRIFVYNFKDNKIPGESKREKGYWRDIGDLDAYYESNMEVLSQNPMLNLHNPEWPLFTYAGRREKPATQPAKFVGSGIALESIVANGSIISNSKVEKSVLSYHVNVEKGADVSESLLLGYTKVGKNVRIRRAIIDREVEIPDNEIIGEDSVKDRRRGFTVSPKGITVVPSHYRFERKK